MSKQKQTRHNKIANVGYVVKEKNHIISERGKLAQKEYKTKHNWVGMVIHWELCKKFKFDHTNKWYINKPESVLENETHKLFWDFEIKNGSPNPGQTNRPRDKKQKTKTKKPSRIEDFAIPSDHKVK